MRTTIDLPEDLLRKAKEISARTRRSVSEVVSDAVRESFTRRAQPRKQIRLTTAGHNSKVLPGIDFSDNASVWAVLSEGEMEKLFGQSEHADE